MSGAVVRRWIFWLALVAFIAWDFGWSVPVNLRFEPPIFSAGSGTPSSAGHCAILN